MNQVAFEVIGNDVTITMASEAGQLQLNAFEPIMGWSLFKSIEHLTPPADTLRHAQEDQGQRCCTMGVRESSGALSYTLGDGKFAGFHIEVCQKVLADVQKQLGLAKLDVKYQPVTSQNRIPLVQNGTVDIECGSTTNNATRQKDVAFAVTTYVEEVRIAVKANSGITRSPSSTARRSPPPPAPPRCSCCASTSAPTA
jgi:ABC-type amino acid transport substrate-binding protein